MAEFTLPSGSMVEIREPTFGEELKIVSAGADNIEELIYLKLEVMVPTLSREQIGALPRRDGRALITEVSRIWDERPPEEDIPFGNGSEPLSTASSLKRSTAKQPRG